MQSATPSTRSSSSGHGPSVAMREIEIGELFQSSSALFGGVGVVPKQSILVEYRCDRPLSINVVVRHFSVKDSCSLLPLIFRN